MAYRSADAIGSTVPGWVQTRMGGQGAPVTPEQSIAGMRKVIDGLTHKDSGAFLDFEGKTVPW